MRAYTNPRILTKPCHWALSCLAVYNPSHPMKRWYNNAAADIMFECTNAMSEFTNIVSGRMCLICAYECELWNPVTVSCLSWILLMNGKWVSLWSHSFSLMAYSFSFIAFSFVFLLACPYASIRNWMAHACSRLNHKVALHAQRGLKLPIICQWTFWAIGSEIKKLCQYDEK